MSIATLAATNRFSIITIADPGVDSPAWNARLGWPSFGDAHVVLALSRDSQRSVWAAKLDAAVMNADRAVVLVAEGVGCFATSWWARLSPQDYVSKVAGALLFDPGQPADAGKRDLFASPRIALPFPSMVLSRGMDASDLRGAVDGWGSRLVNGGRQRTRGTPAWRNAQRLISRMAAVVVEHEVQRGLALVAREGD